MSSCESLTKRTVGQHTKAHAAEVPDNLSAIAEHYQKQPRAGLGQHQSSMYRGQTDTSQGTRGCFYKETDQPRLK